MGGVEGYMCVYACVLRKADKQVSLWKSAFGVLFQM